MSDANVLAEFEGQRPRLAALAQRMLGSCTEADDALQEAWLRVDRADATDVDNLDGWFTTITARVCLNMLRARSTRREDPFDNVDQTRSARWSMGRISRRRSPSRLVRR